jgi:RNA polymerase sigma factor (sigma-70 family)
MASESVNSLPSKDLSTLFRLGVVGNLTDGQLLESFLAGNKETAEASFTALVDRHGPMVLRVCTQILGIVDDAQDAFQATFLVLVRRAGSVRRHDSVASWLYGIALRVARRARADAIRRQIHERRSAATAREQDMTPEVEPECSWPDLHDELGRLPETSRESVVLC